MSPRSSGFSSGVTLRGRTPFATNQRSITPLIGLVSITLSVILMMTYILAPVESVYPAPQAQNPYYYVRPENLAKTQRSRWTFDTYDGTDDFSPQSGTSATFVTVSGERPSVVSNACYATSSCFQYSDQTVFSQNALNITLNVTTTEFTLSFWVYQNRPTSPTYQAIAYLTTQSGAPFLEIDQEGSSTQLVFNVFGYPTSLSKAISNLGDGSAAAHRVIVVGVLSTNHNNPNSGVGWFRFWYDSSTAAVTVSANARCWSFGQLVFSAPRPSSANSYGYIKIDDVQFYNRAFGEKEVAVLARLSGNIACFGLAAWEPGVCGGNPRTSGCIKPDVCQCTGTFGALDCSEPICSGYQSSDPRVCSGQGFCRDTYDQSNKYLGNFCTCDPQRFLGANCDVPICGNSTQSAQQCSGHGTCTRGDIVDMPWIAFPYSRRKRLVITNTATSGTLSQGVTVTIPFSTAGMSAAQSCLRIRVLYFPPDGSSPLDVPRALNNCGGDNSTIQFRTQAPVSVSDARYAIYDSGSDTRWTPRSELFKEAFVLHSNYTTDVSPTITQNFGVPWIPILDTQAIGGQLNVLQNAFYMRGEMSTLSIPLIDFQLNVTGINMGPNWVAKQKYGGVGLIDDNFNGFGFYTLVTNPDYNTTYGIGQIAGFTNILAPRAFIDTNDPFPRTGDLSGISFTSYKGTMTMQFIDGKGGLLTKLVVSYPPTAAYTRVIIYGTYQYSVKNVQVSGYSGEYQVSVGDWEYAPDNSCKCYSGFYGSTCNVTSCYGLLSNDTNVCNGAGFCDAPDTCRCVNSNVNGLQCENAYCSGIKAGTPGVCSGHGTCSKLGECKCTSGFTGTNCEIVSCFGLKNTDPAVCGGHGTCQGPDSCKCNPLWFGDQCTDTQCYSIWANDTNVCSGRPGACTGPNNCSCPGSAYGPSCSFATDRAVYTLTSNDTLAPLASMADVTASWSLVVNTYIPRNLLQQFTCFASMIAATDMIPDLARNITTVICPIAPISYTYQFSAQLNFNGKVVASPVMVLTWLQVGKYALRQQSDSRIYGVTGTPFNTTLYLTSTMASLLVPSLQCLLNGTAVPMEMGGDLNSVTCTVTSAISGIATLSIRYNNPNRNFNSVITNADTQVVIWDAVTATPDKTRGNFIQLYTLPANNFFLRVPDSLIIPLQILASSSRLFCSADGISVTATYVTGTSPPVFSCGSIGPFASPRISNVTLVLRSYQDSTLTINPIALTQSLPMYFISPITVLSLSPGLGLARTPTNLVMQLQLQYPLLQSSDLIYSCKFVPTGGSVPVQFGLDGSVTCLGVNTTSIGSHSASFCVISPSTSTSYCTSSQRYYSIQSQQLLRVDPYDVVAAASDGIYSVLPVFQTAFTLPDAVATVYCYFFSPGTSTLVYSSRAYLKQANQYTCDYSLASLPSTTTLDVRVAVKSGYLSSELYLDQGPVPLVFITAQAFSSLPGALKVSQLISNTVLDVTTPSLSNVSLSWQMTFNSPVDGQLSTLYFNCQSVPMQKVLCSLSPTSSGTVPPLVVQAKNYLVVTRVAQYSYLSTPSPVTLIDDRVNMTPLPSFYSPQQLSSVRQFKLDRACVIPSGQLLCRVQRNAQNGTFLREDLVAATCDGNSTVSCDIPASVPFLPVEHTANIWLTFQTNISTYVTITANPIAVPVTSVMFYPRYVTNDQTGSLLLVRSDGVTPFVVPSFSLTYATATGATVYDSSYQQVVIPIDTNRFATTGQVSLSVSSFPVLVGQGAVRFASVRLSGAPLLGDILLQNEIIIYTTANPSNYQLMPSISPLVALRNSQVSLTVLPSAIKNGATVPQALFFCREFVGASAFTDILDSSVSGSSITCRVDLSSPRYKNVKHAGYVPMLQLPTSVLRDPINAPQGVLPISTQNITFYVVDQGTLELNGTQPLIAQAPSPFRFKLRLRAALPAGLFSSVACRVDFTNGTILYGESSSTTVSSDGSGNTLISCNVNPGSKDTQGVARLSVWSGQDVMLSNSTIQIIFAPNSKVIGYREVLYVNIVGNITMTIAARSLFDQQQFVSAGVKVFCSYMDNDIQKSIDAILSASVQGQVVCLNVPITSTTQASFDVWFQYSTISIKITSPPMAATIAPGSFAQDNFYDIGPPANNYNFYVYNKFVTLGFPWELQFFAGGAPVFPVQCTPITSFTSSCQLLGSAVSTAVSGNTIRPFNFYSIGDSTQPFQGTGQYWTIYQRNSFQAPYSYYPTGTVLVTFNVLSPITTLSASSLTDMLKFMVGAVEEDEAYVLSQRTISSSFTVQIQTRPTTRSTTMSLMYYSPYISNPGNMVSVASISAWLYAPQPITPLSGSTVVYAGDSLDLTVRLSSRPGDNNMALQSPSMIFCALTKSQVFDVAQEYFYARASNADSTNATVRCTLTVPEPSVWYMHILVKDGQAYNGAFAISDQPITVSFLPQLRLTGVDIFESTSAFGQAIMPITSHSYTHPDWYSNGNFSSNPNVQVACRYQNGAAGGIVYAPASAMAQTAGSPSITQFLCTVLRSIDCTQTCTRAVDLVISVQPSSGNSSALWFVIANSTSVATLTFISPAPILFMNPNFIAVTSTSYTGSIEMRYSNALQSDTGLFCAIDPSLLFAATLKSSSGQTSVVTCTIVLTLSSLPSQSITYVPVSLVRRIGSTTNVLSTTTFNLVFLYQPALVLSQNFVTYTGGSTMTSVNVTNLVIDGRKLPPDVSWQISSNVAGFDGFASCTTMATGVSSNVGCVFGGAKPVPNPRIEALSLCFSFSIYQNCYTLGTVSTFAVASASATPFFGSSSTLRSQQIQIVPAVFDPLDVQQSGMNWRCQVQMPDGSSLLLPATVVQDGAGSFLCSLPRSNMPGTAQVSITILDSPAVPITSSVSVQLVDTIAYTGKYLSSTGLTDVTFITPVPPTGITVPSMAASVRNRQTSTVMDSCTYTQSSLLVQCKSPRVLMSGQTREVIDVDVTNGQQAVVAVSLSNPFVVYSEPTVTSIVPNAQADQFAAGQTLILQGQDFFEADSILIKYSSAQIATGQCTYISAQQIRCDAPPSTIANVAGTKQILNISVALSMNGGQTFADTGTELILFDKSIAVPSSLVLTNSTCRLGPAQAAYIMGSGFPQELSKGIRVMISDQFGGAMVTGTWVNSSCVFFLMQTSQFLTRSALAFPIAVSISLSMDYGNSWFANSLLVSCQNMDPLRLNPTTFAQHQFVETSLRTGATLSYLLSAFPSARLTLRYQNNTIVTCSNFVTCSIVGLNSKILQEQWPVDAYIELVNGTSRSILALLPSAPLSVVTGTYTLVVPQFFIDTEEIVIYSSKQLLTGIPTGFSLKFDSSTIEPVPKPVYPSLFLDERNYLKVLKPSFVGSSMMASSQTKAIICQTIDDGGQWSCGQPVNIIGMPRITNVQSSKANMQAYQLQATFTANVTVTGSFQNAYVSSTSIKFVMYDGAQPVVFPLSTLKGSIDSTFTSITFEHPSLYALLPTASVLPFKLQMAISTGSTYSDLVSITYTDSFRKPEIYSIQPNLLPFDTSRQITIVGQNLDHAVSCEFYSSDVLEFFGNVSTAPSSTYSNGITCIAPALSRNKVARIGVPDQIQILVVNDLGEKSSLGDYSAVNFYQPVVPIKYSPFSSPTHAKGVNLIVAVQNPNYQLPMYLLMGSVVQSIPCQLIDESTYSCPLDPQDTGNVTVSIGYNKFDWYPVPGPGFSFVPCDAGYTGSSFADICRACPAGTEKGTAGIYPCGACANGTYSSEVASLDCEACPFNSSTYKEGSSTIYDCQCAPGTMVNYFVSVRNASNWCIPCPDGGNCTMTNVTLATIRAEEDYWFSEVDVNRTKLVFYKCFPSGVCPGGAPDSCAPQYRLDRCGQCKPGYYKSKNKCEKCSGDAVWRLLGLLIVLGILTVAFFLFSSVNVSHISSLSIGLTYFQVISIFSSFDIKLPIPVQDTFTAASVLNFNMDFVQPQCLITEMPYIAKWIITLCLPIIAFVLFVLFYIGTELRSFFARFVGKKLFAKVNYRSLDIDVDLVDADGMNLAGKIRARTINFFKRTVRDAKVFVLYAYNCVLWIFKADLNRSQQRVILNKCINSFLTFLSLSFIFMLKQSALIFRCEEQIDGTYTYLESPDIKCYSSSEWFAMLPFAIFFFVVLGVGALVLFTYIALTSYRQKNNKDYNERFKFLLKKFRRKYFYWEAVLVVRKAALSIMFAFLPPMLTVVFSIIIIFVALCLHMLAAPYKKKFHNIIELISLESTLLSLFLGLLFFVDQWPADWVKTAATVISLATVIITATVVILSIVYDIFVRRKKDKKKVKWAKRKAAEEAAAAKASQIDNPALSAFMASSPGSPGGVRASTIPQSSVSLSFVQKLARQVRKEADNEDDDTVQFLPPFADYEPVSDEDEHAPDNINQVMDSLFNKRRFKRKAFLVNRKRKRIGKAAVDAAAKAGQAVTAIQQTLASTAASGDTDLSLLGFGGGSGSTGGDGSQTPAVDEASARWASLLGNDAPLTSSSTGTNK